MKKIVHHYPIISLIFLMIAILFAPLLMAFSPNPLGQMQFFPLIGGIEKLIRIGTWVLENMPWLVEVTQWLTHLFTEECPHGIVKVDPNSPLNGVYTGCFECTFNGIYHKMNHPLMVRPSINEPFDLAPSFKNPCPY